jgi:phosphonate transport system substrate-binding protein
MESKSLLTCTRRRFVGAAAAWSLGILLGGCAPADPAAGPLYAASPPPGPGGAAYRLAVHPLHNPTKLLLIYGELTDYLSARLPTARIALEASNDYAHFEDKLAQRAPHLVLPNPYQALRALDRGYRVIAEVGDSADFRGLFIARRDRIPASPAALHGQALCYPAPTALAAAMLPELWLARRGLDVRGETESVYVGSQESAILAAHRGECALGVTWPLAWRAFQRSHPAEAAELVVVWETDALINNAVMVRDDLPPPLVVQVRELLLDMTAQDDGRALLQRLTIARFNPADDARYREAMQAFLDEYTAKLGGLP